MKWAKTKLDFLFIDGDHTYEGAKRDFDLYKQLVRSGGIIALHDIAVHPMNPTCKVDVLWNEIIQKYQYKEFIESSKQGWAGIGLIEVK